MSSLAFAVICAACAIVFAYILYRILVGEWIHDTHKREKAEDPARHNERQP